MSISNKKNLRTHESDTSPHPSGPEQVASREKSRPGETKTIIFNLKFMLRTVVVHGEARLGTKLKTPEKLSAASVYDIHV